MTRDQYTKHIAVRVPGACPCCGDPPSESLGGNGCFCAAHYADVKEMLRAESAARSDDQHNKYVRAGREAAITRADGGRTTFRNGTREVARTPNYGKYREIKDRYVQSRGW